MSDMNCDDCATWVHPYLDNELDAATAALVGAHLERCAACRAKFDEMGALRSGIRQHLPYHAAPAALRRQVLAQLRPHRPVRETAHGQGWLRWLAPAFSTVTVF